MYVCICIIIWNKIYLFLTCIYYTYNEILKILLLYLYERERERHFSITIFLSVIYLIDPFLVLSWSVDRLTSNRQGARHRTPGSPLLPLSRGCNKKIPSTGIRVKGCLKYRLWRYSTSHEDRVRSPANSTWT